MDDQVLMILIGVVFLGLSAWELFSGKARLKYWSVERDRNPFWYWTAVVLKLGLGTTILGLSFST